MQRHVVCKKEELKPGSIRAVKASGRRIAVACLGNNSYRAVADTCPHEMASLAKGKVEKMWLSDRLGHHRTAEKECVVICPWHNFEFDLDTGLSPCEPDRLRIKTYRASLESDEVVVYI
jgi:nitrite reductase/ring-hydroxylating ferredoxin subunit